MLRRVNFRFPIFLTSCLVMALGGVASPSTRAAEISPWLKSKFQNRSESQFDALIFLKAQATFENVETLTDRTARIAEVYARLVNVAKSTQGPITEWLKQERLAYRSFHIVNMIAVEGASPHQLSQLAGRGDVDFIGGNPNVRWKAVGARSRGDVTPSKRAPGVNLTEIGVPKVWSQLNTKGQGIVIAGADTGYQWDHPALKPQYRGWNGVTADHKYSWHDAIHKDLDGQPNPCGLNSLMPCDDDDHGTHTMGTMVGDDGGNNQIGVAPRAKWIGCRNMESGIGRPSQYLECFEWFLAPWAPGANPQTDGNPVMAPHVINNSWGCDESEGCHGAEILPALKALKAAGIMTIVSAGNEGPDCGTVLSQPATHTEMQFSVGAWDSGNRKIASFSSRGPSAFDQGLAPLIVAPGVDIRSSVRGSQYAKIGWSGTSMAGPHVAGAVALLWSLRPDFMGKIPETIQHFTQSATPQTTSQSCGGVSGNKIPNHTLGFGLMNVFESLVRGI